MKILLALFLLVFLSACSTFYYGYSKAEWNSLPPQVKAEVKAEYSQVVAEKNTLVFGNSADDASQAFTDRALEKTQGGFTHGGKTRL